VLENGQLVLTDNPVPKTSPQGRFIYSLSQHSSLAYFLVQRYFDLGAAYRKTKAHPENVNSSVTSITSIRPEKEDFKLTIALLDKIRSIAESRKAKFMIVATDRWWNSTSGGTYKEFVNALQDNGFLVLDVESMPGFDSEEMLIPNDGHWNQAGHQFVAEKIKAFIDTNHLLSQP
jgi:hypothetical protein